MVRHYFPQSFKGSVAQNTNFPPQGVEAIPDTGEDDMIFENSNKMLFENGNEMEYDP